MANTYTLIASNSLTNSTTNTVTFSSIPQTYTDLKLVISARSDITGQQYANIVIQPNGATTNLSDKNLYTINGTTVGSGFDSNGMVIGQASTDDQTSNVFGNSEAYIPNYTGSNYKSSSMDGVNENNATSAALTFFAGLWQSTAAITSLDIKFLSGSGTNFKQYSTFYLYGIKNS
jgi:hypothetical protein